MFNLFKKKKKTNPLGFYQNPDIITFRNSLKDQQKAAMFYVSFIVLAADGKNFSAKMNNYILEQAVALNFDVLENEAMTEYKSKDTEFAYKIISDFSNEQKKWFAISLYSMLYDTGDKASQNQMDLYIHIGEKTSNPFMQ